MGGQKNWLQTAIRLPQLQHLKVYPTTVVRQVFREEHEKFEGDSARDLSLAQQYIEDVVHRFKKEREPKFTVHVGVVIYWRS